MNAGGNARTRKDLRVPELVACAVALLAVVDTWQGRWIAPVFWAALLVAGAIALAALGSRRPGGHDAPAWATHHVAAGLLLLAVLQIASIPTAAVPAVSQNGHAHGASLTPAVIAVIASIAAVGYAVLTVLVLPRVRGWRARVPAIAMAAIVMLIAGSVVA